MKRPISKITIPTNTATPTMMAMDIPARKQAEHEFHETFMKKDSKRCCDTTTPESIHTKDESKRGSAFAFIFGVN